MSYLNTKLKETAFSISIRHILKNKKLSCAKMAEKIISLYIELFNLENSSSKFNLDEFSNYIKSFDSVDEAKILQWLNSNNK